MFNKLKRRLVLLYSITTSIILTMIVSGVFFINAKQSREQIHVLFKKNVEQVTEKIRSENVINSSWLSKIQNDNHLSIFIEDNGKPLTNYSYINMRSDSIKVIKKLKELAATEGINLNRKPLFSTVKETSIYQIKQVGIDYLGMAILVPKDSGWLNIMAVYYDSKSKNLFFRQIFLFLLIDLIGVAALFLISTLYIGKVLKPLEEGQKEQNAFVASASHELRSPLTVIKAGISSIKEDSSKAEQFLTHIEGECNRMTRLISDMLLLASSDAGTWSLVKERVDMDTLLIESYDMFCTLHNENNYQLSLNLPQEDLHSIYGDRERIKQILTILVDNAMSYTPKGGIIAINSYNKKHFVVVEVEDHGKGIEEEDKKHIFDRFYRSDKSRNEKNHFGLGLSIAKELIELNQGSITVRDTVGGGATFILQLPY